jgi:hypothetical protein
MSMLVPILWGPVGLGFWVFVAVMMNRNRKES